MLNQSLRTFVRGRGSLLVATTILLLTAAISQFDTRSSAQKAVKQAPQDDSAIFAGTISGRVFQDFNGNGAYDTSGGTTASPTAVDIGVAGVTATAYDLAGAAAGSAVSAANGTFSISATGTGPYRVEFTNLPSGYYPSAHSTDSVAGGAAADSGSTTQFVANTNTSNVNLALNRPGDYCQNNPEICSQLYGVGSPSISNAVFTVPFTAGSTRTTGGLPVADFQSPGNTSLATSNQVGTTFGIAYKRSTRRVFVAAYMKKHAKFGPGGPGAIYQIDRGTGTVSEYVNINTVFGAGTAGTDPHNTADYNTDNGQATWDAVGKIAFGGMAISDDDQYLYVMNLADRRLYRIPTTGALNSTTIQSVAFPATMPNCTTAGDVRPFAVTWHEGTVYVGAVCSREASGTTTSTNLRAYVYRFNPTTMTFAATPDMNFQLNYTRLETDPGLSAAWLNWRSTFVTISGSHFIYPQPMLTDIDFDRQNLILSIRDRDGDQSGYNNASNPNNSSQLFKGITAGDILRACGDPTLGWTLESNGRCGGQGTATQNTNEGPGGGEFYFQDNYHPNGTPHDEVSLGGVAQIPGFNIMAATIFDPTYIPTDNIYDSAGFRWLDNTNGTQVRGYLAYTSGIFGKANGLGNAAPLCSAAPIEIGNRVWRDSNGNGVQDPGESSVGTGPSMAGIMVRLYDSSGNLIASALTDANGEYYFSSASGTSTGNAIYNLNLLPNTTYQVRFDNAADYLLGGPLAGLTLTTPNQTSQAGDDDSSDSDAVNFLNPLGSPPGVYPVITLTTGPAGANNHTFDVGFRAGVTAADASIEGRAVTADGRGIRNVRLTLVLADGTRMQAISSTFGYYRFEGIEAGQTVLLNINSKRFRFANNTIAITVGDDLADVDFIAEN